MKLLKGVTILTVVYTIFYLMGAWILVFTEMSYRTWVDALGKIIIIWVLPLLGIIWTGIWLKQTSVENRIGKAIVMLVEVVVYVGWTYFGFWLLVFSIDEEKMLTPNLLVTNHAEFLGESHYVYYRPIALFFKVPGELTAEDKKEYLEEKYDREFEMDDTDGNVFYNTEFPEVRVSVELSWMMEFEDDFVEGVLTDCLSEGMEELDIDREYYISENYRGWNGIFYIQLKDESDIPGLAEDASKLIDYVCGRTALFEENRGYLYFYCGEIKGLIPFGKLGIWDKQDSDYYLYPEKLEEYIQEKYETSVKNQKEREESRKEWEEKQKEWEESLAANEQDSYTDEEFVDPVETNAKIVYDEVLAEQGYSYEVCYNAKGNLYLNLGSRPAGEPEDNYDTGTYLFTLVYDRTSKNGACELFVLYKEHYTEEERTSFNDATAILDMYAVEVGTGRVVVADKQSWSDVGTKEYRELTGE